MDTGGDSHPGARPHGPARVLAGPGARALGWSMAATLGLVLAELAGGTLGHSVALLNDALHNLSDIVTQLGWCQKAHVEQAIFTHCGSEIVRGNARRLDALIGNLGDDYGIKVRLACDGERLSFADGGRRGGQLDAGQRSQSMIGQ